MQGAPPRTGRNRGGTLAALGGLSLVAAVMGTTAEPAAADFRLCNNTGSRVGIALGYKDSDGWTTEGWWNLSARSCDTLLKGQLVARYYYIYAVDYDRGGEWSGKAFMCTRDKEFTIRGIEDCLARGFDKTAFDAGYVVRAKLAPPIKAPAPRTAAASSGKRLRKARARHHSCGQGR